MSYLERAIKGGYANITGSEGKRKSHTLPLTIIVKITRILKKKFVQNTGLN